MGRYPNSQMLHNSKYCFSKHRPDSSLYHIKHLQSPSSGNVRH